jgi:hypothetical protein
MKNSRLKYIILLSCAALILVIAATLITFLPNQQDNISQTVAIDNPVTDMDEQSAVPSIIPTDIPEEVKHLDYYEYFDMYNGSWDSFIDFELSEVWIDGEPYYQLLNTEKDVKIIVDRAQENAVITHAGKSMDYNMIFLLSATAEYTTVTLADITGDGTEELIISHTYTGTGMMRGECDVINLESMTRYTIDDYLNDLGSRVTVEPLEITSEHDVICKVTDINGCIYYGSVKAGDSDLLEDYSYTLEKCNIYYDIGFDSEEQRLFVFTSMVMDQYGGCHLGTISSYMDYNKDTGHFELAEDFSVDIHFPITVDEIVNSGQDVVLSEEDLQLQNSLLDTILTECPDYHNYDVDITADDFTVNGEKEFFFLFTKKGTDKEDNFGYQADLWFGSKDGVKQVVDQQYIYVDQGKETVTLGGIKYFRYYQPYAANSYTYFVRVDDMEPVTYMIRGYAVISEKDPDFTVNFDCYDMCYDKELENTLGHTWKSYYYYADEQGFHEYGARQISKEDFQRYLNADMIMEDIKDTYSKKFDAEELTLTYEYYQRCNGLMHINIICETGDSIYYYYRTYVCDTDQALVFYEDGEGQYMEAIDEEAAVYLEPFKNFFYD